MGENFNKDLCDERHLHIEKSIDILFKKVDAIVLLLAGNFFTLLIGVVFIVLKTKGG